MSTAFGLTQRPADIERAPDDRRLSAYHATVDATLFESLICDLHWSLFHVGTLGQLMGACAHARREWTLRAWRHLLHDNSAPAILALRYAPELGLPAALAAAMTKFETSLAALQAETLPFTQSNACARAHLMADVASRWRKLADQGIQLLNALAPYRTRLLASMFEADALMLGQFLQETARGDVRRVNAFGEITLPALTQRRRKTRKLVEHACQVWVNGVAYDAQLSDLSADGLGLICKSPLRAGQVVEVALGDRRLRAEIVWSDQSRHGLRLERRLSADDPLIARNTAATH